MNVMKRTIAVIALAGAALVSTSAIATADTLDPQPQKATYLVYPYPGPYAPGIVPFAAAVPTTALLGVNPFRIL
ncbi:hypothetical protein [Streptomyces sp. HD]|uniref:hypothetical protein n=1 Tax=Streptomyces sp. HD TaxID=3020892 RepID=UPI00232F8AC8|nr:hypothetical protein [Streptomyces sp. HD]MDC0773986.1 hypothetical protein [Streptomyces sp. HD]